MKSGEFPERRFTRRPVRALLAIGLFLTLATIVRGPPRAPPPGPGVGTIRITAVPLNPAAPGETRLGGLRFLGGWALASDDPRFGGISAIRVEEGQVTALSDVGMVMRFAVPIRAGTEPVRFTPLEAGPGPRFNKVNRDTEGMLIQGETAWVTYEHHNMVWRYRTSDWAPLSSARPQPMLHWPGNAGPEGIARLADGRFVVFGEGRDNGSPIGEAVLFDGDPAAPATPAHLIHYNRAPGFRASDAAALPDGRILILTRRFVFPWNWEVRLTLADANGLGSGATIAPREIAALQSPLTVDNMEGLAVTVEGGRTIVWLASDDNFGVYQRTLLLKFELET